MRTLTTIVLLLAAASAMAEHQPFDRYQTILDRQMFGAPPEGFDPTKMPSEVKNSTRKTDAEQAQKEEQVKKAIKFSVINVTGEGETVVGFSDFGDPKNPVNYYLKVGETRNGWTVKEANPDDASMTIEKEGIEVTLKLGGDSATAAGSVNKVAANPARPAGRSLLGGNHLSLREKRHQREEQERAEAAKRAEADRAREMREAQERASREAEREEQRKQLLQIQEELKKAREVREAAKAAEDKGSDEPAD